MRRRKALTVALTVAAVIGLATWVYVGPVSAHPGNTCNPPAGHGNPGCHKAATTTTTAKPTTTTVKPTTTTVKPTTTAAKPTTTTTKANTIKTASNTTTTLQPTTTTASTTSTTTTLMPAATSLLLSSDPMHFYESPNDRKTMEAARAIVAGLALSSTGGPPDSSGPAGGPPSDKAAGLSGAATDEAVTATTGAPVLPAGQAAKTEAAMSPSYYFVSPVAIILLLVYATSFILYKTKSIRVATHRKIWNILLMATFVIVGASGLILAIGVSQDPPWMLPQWLLFWHVEMGITMAFISFFHLAWLASSRLRSSPAERVAAASR